MRLVLLESPYASDPVTNTAYAIECMRDCLERGEAPFTSHLLYTQALDDKIPVERAQGIAAGLCWGKHAEATVVYTDHGVSSGMREGIKRAVIEGRAVEYRRVGDARPGGKTCDEKQAEYVEKRRLYRLQNPPISYIAKPEEPQP